MIVRNVYGTIAVDSLDIGEVVVAGLIKLGHLPEPDPKRQDKYEVFIEEQQNGSFNPTVRVPTIYVRTK